MSNYAIGDIQGCFDPFMRLLDVIQFDDRQDRLWFVGDLVNRGPDSLAVLRFIKALPIKPHITLGNHDLHLLSVLFGSNPRLNKDDTLESILTADDRESLGHWLRKQSILIHDESLNVVMCHAGIAPMWGLKQAKQCAHELERVLRSNQFIAYLDSMYGNDPAIWNDGLSGMNRLRVITNYFTRMRFCDAMGGLVLHYKGTLQAAPANLIPWYAVPNRIEIMPDLVFGHWAALEGKCPIPRLHAIDTGCLWGGELTALRLEDKIRFKV